MVTGLTIEVGARVKYLLHPGAKGCGFFYILQRLIQSAGREIEGARYRRASHGESVCRNAGHNPLLIMYSRSPDSYIRLHTHSPWGARIRQAA
jgi:hypothetical protein